MLIGRVGLRLIIEPQTKAHDILELLAQWRREGPLAEDELPETIDLLAGLEDAGEVA